MKQNKNQINLNEAELRQFVGQLVNEALDEGLWDSIKAGLGQIGKDTAGAAMQGAQGAANYAQRTGQNIANKGRQIGQSIANKGRQIGQNVSNYAGKIQRVGQMASLNADNQRVADQLSKWYQSGVFGDSPAIGRAVSTLVNSMNRNFNGRFGEMGNANWR